MSYVPELLPPAKPRSPPPPPSSAAWPHPNRPTEPPPPWADIDERHNAGCHAYRLALPHTGTQTDIQAFINSVTHGVALGAIEGQETNPLLYAARLALAAASREPGKA